MKIINREQFLKLPNGVVYAKFEPCIFGEIEIKGDSLPNDWYVQDFLELDVNGSDEWVDILFKGMEEGISIPMDFNCESRDGLYDEKQLFAVLEKEDVVSLIARLNKTISAYPEI